MNAQPRLETDQLLLRPYAAGDEAEILRLLTHNREHLRFVLSDWVYAIRTEAEAGMFIKKMRAGWLLKNLFTFGVWWKADGALVGEVVLFNVDRALRQAEVGYYVIEAYAGRGIASRAVAAVLAYAHQQAGIRRVVARCSIHNPGSRRIAERCGFVRQFEAKSIIHYQLNLEPARPLPDGL